jgi:hypothetical protein
MRAVLPSIYKTDSLSVTRFTLAHMLLEVEMLPDQAHPTSKKIIIKIGDALSGH